MKHNYILGSHNSWSYLKPKHWWMRLIAFAARCQCKTIQEQYDLGVRCFDLRVRFDKYEITCVAHGVVEYKIDLSELTSQLKWLDEKKDCYVRIIHEVRQKSQYTTSAINSFTTFCRYMSNKYTNIKWWCGRNLYNWNVDYDFGKEPTCEENYSSVSKPRLLDDWLPWLYARLHNSTIIEHGTIKEILLIDYVNIK